MRSGMSAESAAKRVNLSLSVIRQLEQLAIQGEKNDFQSINQTH